MFGSDDEDLSYIWLSDYDNNDKKLTMDLSFFEKQGDVYKRFDERQIEYAHTTSDLLSELKTNGFELISLTSAYGEELSDSSERAVFLARKK